MITKTKSTTLHIRSTPALLALVEETAKMLNPADRATTTQVVEIALAVLHSALKSGETLPWQEKSYNLKWHQQYELDLAFLRGAALASGDGHGGDL